MTLQQRRMAGFGLAIAIFAGDQFLKWIVNSVLRMELGDSIPLIPIFALTRTHNYGVSLGMFTADTPEMKFGLILVTAAIATGVAIWMLREKALADWLSSSANVRQSLGRLLSEKGAANSD